MNAIVIVVPGRRPRKNARGTIGRKASGGAPFRITPKATRSWRPLLYEIHTGEFVTKGLLEVTIRVYEDRLLHLDVDIPQGDIDSTVSAVLDAIQPLPKNRKHRIPPFVIDDDARIVDLHVFKRYDKANPRIEIIIRSADRDHTLQELPSNGRRDLQQRRVLRRSPT